MGRSLKKGPFVSQKLLAKIDAQLESGDRKPIKTWSRASMITPDFVGLTFLVHAGKNFATVYVTENMVGHKLGEFAPTRVFKQHGGIGPQPATSAPLPALAKAATDFYTHVLAGRSHGIRPCPAARGRKRPSWRESACSSPLRSRSHANRRTLSPRLSGPVFHYLTAPAEQQRIL